MYRSPRLTTFLVRWERIMSLGDGFRITSSLEGIGAHWPKHAPSRWFLPVEELLSEKPPILGQFA
jgi:hypothetical protein